MKAVLAQESQERSSGSPTRLWPQVPLRLFMADEFQTECKKESSRVGTFLGKAPGHRAVPWDPPGAQASSAPL